MTDLAAVNLLAAKQDLEVVQRYWSEGRRIELDGQYVVRRPTSRRTIEAGPFDTLDEVERYLRASQKASTGVGDDGMSEHFQIVADASGGIVVLAPESMTTDEAMDKAMQSVMWPSYPIKLREATSNGDGRTRYLLTPGK